MKVVVCNAGGGGITVEEEIGQGKEKKTVLRKKLVGETVDLDDKVAAKLIQAGKVKPDVPDATDAT